MFKLLVLATCFFSTAVLAQETGWLELQEGYKEDAMGAKMHRIENNGDDGSKLVTVSIPKSSIKEHEGIEEIVVIGYQKQKEKREPILEISYEWADNFDEDNYGLLLKLGKDAKFPIRLYFKGDEHINNP